MTLLRDIFDDWVMDGVVKKIVLFLFWRERVTLTVKSPGDYMHVWSWLSRNIGDDRWFCTWDGPVTEMTFYFRTARDRLFFMLRWM